MKMKSKLFWLMFVFVTGVWLMAEVGYAEGFFVPSDKVSGEYRVDTGFLSGTFRLDGKSIGFVPFRTVSPEREIAGYPGLPGLLNFYRVFKTNYRFGESMREVKSEAKLLNPKTLKVFWDSDAEHPFTLTAVYQWINPQTLDLLITVEAKQVLPDFEVFLSSYLTKYFPESYVYAKGDDGTAKFLPTPVEAGEWQAFPKDENATKIIKDGRWDILPNPVNWTIRPFFREPIIYRIDRETKLAVVHITTSNNCFAVSTPNAGNTHFSMYLSLFGKTLEAGQSISTTVRMIIAPLNEQQILNAYKVFTSTLPKEKG